MCRWKVLSRIYSVNDVDWVIEWLIETDGELGSQSYEEIYNNRETVGRWTYGMRRFNNWN
jgi:hypothetical protein